MPKLPEQQEIEVTVIFPVTFKIMLAKNSPENEKRELILDFAGASLERETPNPVIHRCSDENLED